MNFLWRSFPLIAIAFTLWRLRRKGTDRASSTNSSHENACEPVSANEPWISSSLFKLYEPSPLHRTDMDIFFFHGPIFQHGKAQMLGRRSGLKVGFQENILKRESFLDSIKGIFFYGTPHPGMDGSFWDHSVKSNMGANELLLNVVKVPSSTATRLHAEFKERQRDYKWQIYSIGETQAVVGQRIPLVPKASARYGGDKYITVESDHFSICRPINQTCDKYLHLIHLVDTIYIEKQDEGRGLQKVRKVTMGVESLLMEVQKKLYKHVFLKLFGMDGIGKMDQNTLK